MQVGRWRCYFVAGGRDSLTAFSLSHGIQKQVLQTNILPTPIQGSLLSLSAKQLLDDARPQIMNNPNKNTQRQVHTVDSQSFRNEEEVGLFTFYKMQENSDPLHLPLLPPSKSPRWPQKEEASVLRMIDKKRSRTEVKRQPVHRQETRKEEKREVTEKVTQLKNKPSIEMFRCRLQNLVEISFESKNVRKNAFKYDNYPTLRLKTEPQTTRHHRPNISGLPGSIQLMRISEVTSEEVKHLFKPKRKAISRYLSSSLSNAELKLQLKQPRRQQKADRKKLKLLEVEDDIDMNDKLKELKKNRSGRQDHIGFLNYLYQQKKLLSQQYSQLKHKKRMDEILMTSKIQQKTFRKIKFNNSPLVSPVHLSRPGECEVAFEEKEVILDKI